MISFGQRLKLLLKHGVIFGLTSSLQSALAFILLPLFTKFFSVEEFGVYNMILIIGAACNTIFYLGASSVLGRFYYDYKDEGRDVQLVSSAYWVSVGGGIILIIISFLFADLICGLYLDDESLKTPFILCMIGFGMNYPITTLTLLLRYKKKSIFYLIVTISGLLLNFILTLSVLYFSNQKISAPFIGLICSNLMLLVSLTWKSKSDINLKVFNSENITILKYGSQFVLSSFLVFAYQCIDKFVIKELLSISDVGVYSLGYRIASAYHILIYVPFALVWAPLRMEYRKSPNNIFFIKKITVYYTIVSVIFIIGCMIWGNSVLKILFPQSEYVLSLAIYPIIMLGYLFYGWTSIFDFGIYVSNKFIFMSIVPVICCIINTALNFILLPIYGVAASAYIYAFTFFISSIMLLVISNKYHKLYMDWKRLIGVLALCIMAIFVFNYIGQIFVNSIVFKLFSSTVVLFIIYWLFLDDKEKAHVMSYVNKINYD